jgi:hypothetical protein
MVRRHWETFNSQKAKLEGIVGQEFENVVKEIDLTSRLPDVKERRAEVLGYEVEYNPQFKTFKIRITKLKTPRGIMDNKDVLSGSIDCPHSYLDPICGYGEEVNPKVEEFKKRYSVTYIREPDNNCHHQ